MSTITLGEAIDRHGVDVLDHLDRGLEVPVLAGLQLQGDVAVVPNAIANTGTATTPVPAAGVPVVRGENGGNTHLLLADGPVMFDLYDNGNARSVVGLGVLTVPDDATAWLAHPEHGYVGIAPGTYEIRRQREQAEEERLVAD